jgi:MGT family glycosyltransferase
MSRILFVVPPLTGHVNPTVGLGQELAARGHDVAWAGYEEALRPLLGDAAILQLSSELSDADYTALREEGAGLRGAAAFKFLWERLFFPLARWMTPGVDEAVDAWRADALVVDQQTFAGAIVGRRRGLPWATSAATSASLVDPIGALPQLRAWYEDGLQALQREHGLEPSPQGMLSPHAVIAWTTHALVGADRTFPPPWHLVGPAAAPRPVDVPFPWERLRSDRPKVLVSLGTVSAEAGGRFFREALAATEALGVQAIVVAPPELLPDAPPGAIVQGYVPQLAVLARVDAVIGHAGHNTTVEALAEGLPLVLAPIRDDQPIVAQQVVDAGAGIRVRFGRVRAARLEDALRRVLEEPSFREAAGRIRASFRQAGGVPHAADIVEDLVRR